MRSQPEGNILKTSSFQMKLWVIWKALFHSQFVTRLSLPTSHDGKKDGVRGEDMTGEVYVAHRHNVRGTHKRTGRSMGGEEEDRPEETPYGCLSLSPAPTAPLYT